MELADVYKKILINQMQTNKNFEQWAEHGDKQLFDRKICSYFYFFSQQLEPMLIIEE